MTARFLTLRPSSLKAQRAKIAGKATTAEKRAARRLRDALDAALAAKAGRWRVKPETVSEAAERGLTTAGFHEWFRSQFANAADMLPEQEFVSFHTFAREFYFGRLPAREWNGLCRSLAEKAAAAQPVAEARLPARPWSGQRPLGW